MLHDTASWNTIQQNFNLFFQFFRTFSHVQLEPAFDRPMVAFNLAIGLRIGMIIGNELLFFSLGQQ